MVTHYPHRILSDEGLRTSAADAQAAGVGATPVLAMLHALAEAGSQRQIRWVHTTHDRELHAFATEVTRLIEALPHAQQRIFYTAEPGPGRPAERLNASSIAMLNLPTEAAVYLCDPNAFMDDMRAALTAVGIDQGTCSDQNDIHRIRPRETRRCRVKDRSTYPPKLLGNID